MDLITLENKNKSTLVKGVILHPLKINKDASGVLVETLRTDWKGIYGPNRKFAMQYYSVTESGVARDEDVWHYHPTGQEDRFLLVQGAVVCAIADTRKGSITKGLLNLFYMQAEKYPYILLIPKKTLHGFLVVSQAPAILLNFPTKLYDPKEEGRIPYSKVNIKMKDGSSFSWKNVRKNLIELSSRNVKD